MQAADRTGTGRNVVVVGTQWGDEGKGKVVDWLTDHAQGVVRFQGGHNAGHTLVINGRQDRAAADPVAASCATGVACYIGNGVVVDPAHLLVEIERLEALGVEVRSRLFISESCPLILPFHVGARRGARGAAREQRQRQDRHHRQGHRPGLRGQGRAPRAARAGPEASRALRGQAARAAGAAQRRAHRLPAARRPLELRSRCFDAGDGARPSSSSR